MRSMTVWGNLLGIDWSLMRAFLQVTEMLIRVHEESFVLFFFNSFILLDKKPFLIAVVGLIGAILMFVFMGNKILKGDQQGLEFKV